MFLAGSVPLGAVSRRRIAPPLARGLNLGCPAVCVHLCLLEPPRRIA